MRKDVLGRTAVAALTTVALAGAAAGTANAQPLPGVTQISDSTAWTVSTTPTSATFTLEPPSMNRCSTTVTKGSSERAQALLDWQVENPQATPEEQAAKAAEYGIELIPFVKVVDGELVAVYPSLAFADDLKADWGNGAGDTFAEYVAIIDEIYWPGMIMVGDHTATLDLDPGHYLLSAMCQRAEIVEINQGQYVLEDVDGTQQVHVKEFVVGQTEPEPEPEDKPGLLEGLFGSLSS